MCYKELECAIMKAGKSHDLPSSGSNPRTASGVVSRTRKANDVNFSRGQKVTNVPASQPGRENEFVLTLPFCSIQAISRLGDAQLH